MVTGLSAFAARKALASGPAQTPQRQNEGVQPEDGTLEIEASIGLRDSGLHLENERSSLGIPNQSSGLNQTSMELDETTQLSSYA